PCSHVPMSPMLKPPPTKSQPFYETVHGIEVSDPYRWLEGDNSDPADQGKSTPNVEHWTDQQNAYTRARLDNLPGRTQLEARLRPLMEVGAVTLPVVRGGRYFYTLREGTQNQPVVYWRERHDSAPQVLIDPAVLDPSGLTTVEWFSPSQNGRLVAYGT